MNTAWSYWINEPIYWNKGSCSYDKRKHVYADLCRNGVFPMLKNAGYTVRLSESECLKQILMILFHMWRGKQVRPKDVNSEIHYETEQYFHFHYRIDTMDWLQFWETWGGIQDLEYGSFGHDFCFQLPEFLWSWISIEHSPAALEFEKELEEEEYQEELAKGKDDPYLQDNSKRDYQDRHWF